MPRERPHKVENGRDADDDDRPVRPDGLGIRGRRHALGWSPRDLINAIGRARTRETGMWETITPNVLRGIEEQSEAIPYGTLCLVAAGLDCNPAELVAWDAATTHPRDR